MTPYRTTIRNRYSHRGITVRFDKPWELPRLNAGLIRLIDPSTQLTTLFPAADTYYFEELKQNLEKLQDFYEPVYCLFRTPRWLSSRPDEPYPTENRTGVCAPPYDLNEIKKYLTAFMAEFPQIRYFEIWNEPWSKKHWTGTIDELVELTKICYQTIKSINPFATVICSADNYDTSIMEGETRSRVEKFDEYVGKAKDWFDVIGVHLYSPTYTRLANNIDGFKAIAAKHHLQDREMWCTEVGVKNIANMPKYEAQACLTSLFLTCESKGIDRTIFFIWNGDDPLSINNPQQDIAGAWHKM